MCAHACVRACVCVCVCVCACVCVYGIYCIVTVLLKGNAALARNFLSSRQNHSIEQRVERVASQANTRLDTRELASFNSARCEDSKELDTPHC